MRYLSEEYIYCGNFFPVKKIIEDIKQGKNRTIAFLGASVSTGEGIKRGNEYFSVLRNKWNDAMNTDHSPIWINASRTGTLSGNCLFSMNDLLEKKPDLVFLDYSVNDPGLTYLAETFEAVVHRFLSAGCAVAIMLFCNERGTSTKGSMIRIARHYQLPIIDFGKLIMDQIAQGEMTWSDFAYDYVHPNNWGHEYLADNLLRFFSMVEQSDHECAPQIPNTPCFSGVFCDVQFIEGIEYSEDGIEFEVEGSSLLVEYTQNPEGSDCAADIYIDNVFVRTIERFAEISWDNRVVHSIYEGYENSRHNIRIMPAKNHTCSKEEWKLMDIKLGVGCFPEDLEEDE